MRLILLLKAFFSLIVTVLAVQVSAQIHVTLGPDEIGENQAWTMTITVQNERLKSYDNFPEIEGFRKRGTSTQSTTNIVNGQVSSSQSVIMTYNPTRQGTFNIPGFTITVNDKPVRVQGKKVKVGPPVQRQQSDPFKNFFDRSPADDFFGRGETEFVDVKEDAFLALTTSKDEVYAGEGFNVTLSFFVAENNRARLQFHELPRQLSEILKKVRPVNCWEENFNIENIEGESVTIGGKEYNQYKIYQATLFPLNAEPISFPSVGLEDFKTFYSRPKKVTVKELPPHPLRDVVAVGDYHLDEGLRSTDLETGKSAAYQFNVYGEGNISAIEKPILKNDDTFEFYEPNVRQDINRANNRITGTKSFSYYMIPIEPGQYKLGDYFQWIYFDPARKKYDTLKSALTVYVKGESKKNEAIQSNDPGSFYDKIETTDNALRTIADTRWQQWAFNGFIAFMLAASVYLVLKK
jgi:hypothetical protein